jgi:hypothetical protein
MELQAPSPVLIEALRAVAGCDAATAVVKEVRTETPRMPVSRPIIKAVIEEVMVPDQRSGLSPAQSVEQKLSAMLRGGAAMPVSHYRLAKFCRKG